MDTTSLYYGQRCRNWRQRHRDAESAEALLQDNRGEPIRESKTTFREASTGSTIGYWLIPSGDAYLKLKILDTYNVTTDGGKVLKKDGFDSRYPHPIWPVVVNRSVLRSHFNWLYSVVGEDSEEMPGLYDRNAIKSDEVARHAVQGLAWRGWRYFAREGNTCYFGGSASKKDPLFLKLVDELTGKDIQRPNSVGISMNGVTEIVFLDADGVERGKMDLKDVMTPTSAPSAPKPDLNAALSNFVRKDQPASALVYLAQHVRSAEEFNSLDLPTLGRVLSPKPFSGAINRVLASYPGSKQKCAALVAGYSLRCAQSGVPVPNLVEYPNWVQDVLSESLTEGKICETGYLDLWNSTRINGEYKYGGMKRVRGRWIYDPTVPGRTQNGKRFVTVAMPQVSIDTDGKVILRFRYQSKAARNTSGTSHIGYVKFSDHAGFMRTASRHITKAMAKRDVHVHCSCQDFKYRWHWVLARQDAAPTPVGPGAAPPDITNPRKLVAMCKHLTAISPFILFRPQALDKEIRAVLKKVRGAPTKPAPTTKDDVAPIVKDGVSTTTTAQPTNMPDDNPE